MEHIFSNYDIPVDEASAKDSLNNIRKNIKELNTIEHLKTIFSCIDLTTLSVTDTQEKAKLFADNVSSFHEHFPDMPNVAAICVYPSLVHTVKKNLLKQEINIASVVGGFPASQTHIDIKCVETSYAMTAGANEADMVISVGEFLSGNYELVSDEIIQIKDACGLSHLKVILETGALKSPENIKKASILAMEAGGDFIKTSTGKFDPAATLEAVYVMALSIKEFYNKTGKKIGIKPAGGISDSLTALNYYAVIKHVLGIEWLNPTLFRVGASSLANKILSDINTIKGNNEIINYF